MVQSGDAEAVVSCGNSGAIMAVATLLWRRQPGIDRAAFGSTLPSRDGGVFILDVGANPEVKAENLVQFAVMGEVFVRLQRGIASPRVALLSNGSEDSKGTKEIKEANQELRRANINFIGNVEGNHVFEGTVDVVVCDGFSGNILLKGAEGVGAEVLRLMREELRRDPVSRLAGAALKVSPAYGRIARKLDWEEYGGAPVLGVNGIMINCHGRSTAKSVTQGILLARTMASERLVERIGAALPEEVAESPGRTRRLVRALHLRHGEV
jgi:glycerol-3-phosphate acyltransferase PlsX